MKNMKDILAFASAFDAHERCTSAYRADTAERLIDAHELLTATDGYDPPAMRALHAVDMLIEHMSSGPASDLDTGIYRAKEARDLLRIIVADGIVKAGRAKEDAQPEPVAFCSDAFIAALLTETDVPPAAVAAE